MFEPINEHNLNVECQRIVDWAMDDYGQLGHTDIPMTEHVMTLIAEAVNDHRWVIYPYMAHQLCSGCEIDRGHDYLLDSGLTPSTYDEMATTIAYGEMRTRSEEMFFDLFNAVAA